METQQSSRTLRWRFLMFSVVGVLPFLRFLLVHHYGLFSIEVVLALVLLLLPCATLALISQKESVFALLLLALVVAVSLNTLQAQLLPGVRLRWITGGLVAALAAPMFYMRRNFDRVLLVFAFSVFSVDVSKTVLEGLSRENTESGPAKPHLSHVLYLVLDEQIGLAGFPKDVSASGEAVDALRTVLSQHSFKIYPYAFSNYQRTWDSLPSILNNTLLERTGYYIQPLDGRSVLNGNRLFESYAAKDYAINVYESDFIEFSSSTNNAKRHVYNANSLSAMSVLHLSWQEKIHQILTVYARTDRALWGIYTGIAPQELQPAAFKIGPLAVAAVWPDRLLTDIREARQNTLFFAHLLTPHYPYVYGRKELVRDPEIWKSDDNTWPVFDRSEYLSRYERYCAQVEYLSGQLQDFFRQLREMGVYDAMTVVVLGDHGSRIRFLKEGERREWEKLSVATPDCPGLNRYDYASEPDLQDLLNRFSTLLAIKHPGAHAPSVVPDRGSILFFLRQEFETATGGSGEPGLNSVYLFDAGGLPRKIELLDIWKRNDEGAEH